MYKTYILKSKKTDKLYIGILKILKKEYWNTTLIKANQLKIKVHGK